MQGVFSCPLDEIEKNEFSKSQKNRKKEKLITKELLNLHEDLKAENAKLKKMLAAKEKMIETQTNIIKRKNDNMKTLLKEIKKL